MLEGIIGEVEQSVGQFLAQAGSTARRELSAMFQHVAEVEPTVASALGHVAKAIADNGGAVLIEIAQHAVAAAEATGGNPEQKWQAARAAVAAALQSRGMPVVWNAVNAAIEAAVAMVNASSGIDLGPIAHAAEAALEHPPGS